MKPTRLQLSRAADLWRVAANAHGSGRNARRRLRRHFSRAFGLDSGRSWRNFRKILENPQRWPA